MFSYRKVRRRPDTEKGFQESLLQPKLPPIYQCMDSIEDMETDNGIA